MLLGTMVPVGSHLRGVRRDIGAAAIIPETGQYHWTYGTRIFTSPYIQITSVIFDFTLKVEYTSSKLCLSDWPLLR
jgi:hypothetical protein